MSKCDDYLPPHVEQLHGPDPTAGSDCAICCARMAIMFATCGKVDPSPDKIRAQAGLDEPDPPPSDYSTTMSEYARAVNAFDDEARDRGFPDGIGAGVHEREPWSKLEDVIKDEAKWITTFVDYGMLNAREPGKSGDPGFQGLHAVGVFGYKPSSETEDGSVKFRIWDPLCDGRKASIPKGPTWWKASTLRDACDAYAGGGSGNATWCSTPRATPAETPEPEPPDPCEQATRSAHFLLGELRTWLYENRRFRSEVQKRGALLLRESIGELLGGNDEGLTLPIHSGATPDE